MCLYVKRTKCNMGNCVRTQIMLLRLHFSVQPFQYFDGEISELRFSPKYCTIICAFL